MNNWIGLLLFIAVIMPLIIAALHNAPKCRRGVIPTDKGF
jgi:hypothetical protein